MTVAWDQLYSGNPMVQPSLVAPSPVPLADS
jgi:hypothetical protein